MPIQDEPAMGEEAIEMPEQPAKEEGPAGSIKVPEIGEGPVKEKPAGETGLAPAESEKAPEIGEGPAGTTGQAPAASIMECPVDKEVPAPLATQPSSNMPPPPIPSSSQVPQVNLLPPTPNTSQEAAEYGKTTLLEVPVPSSEPSSIPSPLPTPRSRTRSRSPVLDPSQIRRSPRLTSPAPAPAPLGKRPATNDLEEPAAKKAKGE